jgi:esterase/lipase superfamily enzyme
MDLLWYGHSGRPLLAFATSLGGCNQNEDGGLIRGLADKIEAGDVQVCCPGSIDGESWYNKGAHPAMRAARHDQYDRFLATELVPFIRQKSQREDIVTYGASFGAYHATNFGFRHPDLVSRIVAFSGMFDIHQFLDGYWDDTCYFHCPTAYIPNFSDEWVSRVKDLGVVVATGEHDHLVNSTREFAALLGAKGIPVYSEIWQGVFGHDWPYWREHLRRFVP